jgi:hypothetical protein
MINHGVCVKVTEYTHESILVVERTSRYRDIEQSGHSHLFDVKLELALAGSGPALLTLGNSFACTCRKILASLPRAGEIPFLSSRNLIVRLRSVRSVSSDTIDLN